MDNTKIHSHKKYFRYAQNVATQYVCKQNKSSFAELFDPSDSLN